MPEVADAFRRFGSSYQEAHGAAMLPSHRRAIADIIACRTEALGGQQWCCNHCGTLLHVFHSCRNRACLKCHAEQTQAWLEQRRAEMLPVPYFHVTVTVPEHPRSALGRRHRRRPCRAAYLDATAHPEPSLMMPGIIISLIFSEQGKLVLRA